MSENKYANSVTVKQEHFYKVSYTYMGVYYYLLIDQIYMLSPFHIQEEFLNVFKLKQKKTISISNIERFLSL